MHGKKDSRFQDEGRRLAREFSRYTESVIRLAAEDRADEILSLGRKLRKKIIRYADAQFDVADTTHPFGRLYEDDEEDAAETPERPSGSRTTLLVRLDLRVANADEEAGTAELSTVLTNSLREAIVRWCESELAADPVAHLVAAVEMRATADLESLEPIPDGEEIVRVLAAVETVHFSELDLYQRAYEQGA